ncbi:MAG: nicotinate-nucleotide adenylyltransferase [Clostridium sp.]
MKKYGVMGGTFDPIHLAHVYIAYEAKELLGLDKIIFMPTGSPPHKTEKEVTKASLRYNMVKRAIEGYENFEVSDYESKKEGYSYTYETLQYLKEPNVELYFITGGDCLMDLHKWREVHKIFSLSKLVVFTRPGYTLEDLNNQKIAVEETYGGEVIVLPIRDLDISSTEIRKRISNGKRVDFFLDSKVLELIKEYNLYKKGEAK